MPNPIMNDKAIDEAARAGWGAPNPSTRNTPLGTMLGDPITDGPISEWKGRAMTASGTATATGVLLVLVLAAAAVGWGMTEATPGSEVKFPALAIGGVVLGFICAIVLRFKPTLAKVLGPIYALAEGFFLGAISKVYNDAYEGIVVQAVGATLAVFAVMLFLYKSRIIKVTDRFRRNVIMATMGLMLFYLVSIVINLFGGTVPFLDSASPLGILFSVVAAGLAAMMLAVNFDTIDRGVAAGWPKGMEWYCAFGMLATLVWLYLEILRLLAKLNRR
ncbi:MAG: Bax inhibitor-1/YccA family protein [Actinobacteria bacterium]|nr:Bax inhibitor-1/YccA family protein [Actinomycetota bacterium]